VDAVAGQKFTATLPSPPGPPVGLGARVEFPITRAIASYWRPATLDPATVTWSVDLDAPLDAGDYLIDWRTPDDPPAVEVMVPLHVDATGSVSVGTSPPFVPNPDAPWPWAPTVTQVASVTPNYTRGGFDDDSPESDPEPPSPPVYDASTRPTADEVAGMVLTACGEIEGRVEVAMPERCYRLAQATAIWHTAAQIAGGKKPAGTDDTDGEYRTHITNYRACLDALIVVARRKPGPRLR
jgi:hypothetical protein